MIKIDRKRFNKTKKKENIIIIINKTEKIFILASFLRYLMRHN
jgi:hypothetical protein